LDIKHAQVGGLEAQVPYGTVTYKRFLMPIPEQLIIFVHISDFGVWFWGATRSSVE